MPTLSQSAYWSRPVADLAVELASSPATGLGDDDAAGRLQRDGANRIQEHRRATAARMLLDQFTSPLVLILIFAVGVSAVAGEWVDAAVILTIVLGSAGLSFAQEYSAASAVERLRARVTPRATVLRAGRSVEVPAASVVAGDILCLSAGSMVAADAVVLEAHDCFVNQAVLTGEPFPVEKLAGTAPEGAGLAARLNCVYMGSNVRSGTATAIVVATGMRTCFGQIAARLQKRPEKTEFERGLHRFGLMLAQAMVVLVLVVFAGNVFNARPPVEAMLFAVALAVGLAPELLPAIFTVTLAKGAQLMAARGVIVRRLSAIENLGCMDILCTDKTGTLTEGVMQVQGAFDPEGRPDASVLFHARLNAYFQTGLASAFDEAMLGEGAGAEMTGWRKVDEIPYDFSRKRLSVVVADGDGGEALLVTKGAVEKVLEVSMGLDPAARERVRGNYEAWSEQGLRVLGVASKRLPVASHYGKREEEGMRFLGFVVFFDPPKAGVGEAIAGLQRQGVSLKIITGDSRGVAVHLAKAVGIENPRVLTGADLLAMGNDALWHAAGETTLFAEMDPAQKERVIAALRSTGRVVGFLGDGINDAPALHAADVGISVEGAVDVARDAAEIVLLERDLEVLSEGIRQGRRTFANTLKYIYTTTSANFGNMLSMAGASLFLPFLPLLAKQILLNNFLSDAPAMSIASDNVDDEWIASPRRWDIHSIRRFMVVFGLLSAGFDVVTFLVLLYWLKAPVDVFRTAWFVESLMTELAVALVVRTWRPFYRSRPGNALSVTTGSVALLACAIPYLPGRELFGFVPLDGLTMGSILVITLAYVIVVEAAKRWLPHSGRAK